MSEFVTIRTQNAVPVPGRLDKIILFDKAELSAIAKKRIDFEYKICRYTKCKEVYLMYIKYELNLLKLIKSRRDNCGVTLRKVDMAFAIRDRVKSLFQQATQRFSRDVRLWTTYITFCKKVGFDSLVRSIIVKMVTIHDDKPNVWKIASSWEFTMCHSIENSRKYLQRGLHLHPNSKVLYEEAFHQELKFASVQIKKKNEEDDTVAAAGSVNTSPCISQVTSTTEYHDRIREGQLAEVVYENAIPKIDDIQFYIDLLNVAEEFNFTNKLQNKIVYHLLSKYRNDELAWDTVAQRELEGYTLLESIPGGPQVTPNKKKTSLKERICSCVGVYRTVVEQLNTERMWTFFLESLIDINRDQERLPVYKQKLLTSAFQDAHSAGRLQETYYLQWVALLQSTGKLNKLAIVLQQATEQFFSNVELWQIRIRFHLSKDDECTAINAFIQANTRLGVENTATLSLWMILVHYYETKDIKKAEEVFENGIKFGTSVSNLLKPLFLEWLLSMKGIAAVYKEYEILSLQPPMCLELHLKMIALENKQPDMSVKYIRKCFDVAIRLFGKNSPELWIEYIQFERAHGDPKNVNNVHDQALKTLNIVLIDTFMGQYTFLEYASCANQNGWTHNVDRKE